MKSTTRLTTVDKNEDGHESRTAKKKKVTSITIRKVAKGFIVEEGYDNSGSGPYLSSDQYAFNDPGAARAYVEKCMAKLGIEGDEDEDEEAEA